VTAETDAAPQTQLWCAALQEEPSLRCRILKPCKSAVKPVCDRRTTADGRSRLAHVHAKTRLTAP
jgi:hypothetical protein